MGAEEAGPIGEGGVLSEGFGCFVEGEALKGGLGGEDARDEEEEEADHGVSLAGNGGGGIKKAGSLLIAG